MTPRTDASVPFSAGSQPDMDRDLFAINGHEFDLGIPGLEGLSDSA